VGKENQLEGLSGLVLPLLDLLSEFGFFGFSVQCPQQLRHVLLHSLPDEASFSELKSLHGLHPLPTPHHQDLFDKTKEKYIIGSEARIQWVGLTREIELTSNMNKMIRRVSDA